MRRLGGSALIAHGLAHAWPGSAIVAAGSSWLFGSAVDAMALRWLAAALWALALAGFVAAGLGLWGVTAFRPWRRVARIAALASLVLLLPFRFGVLFLAGTLIDLVILALVRPVPAAVPPVRPDPLEAHR